VVGSALVGVIVDGMGRRLGGDEWMAPMDGRFAMAPSITRSQHLWRIHWEISNEACIRLIPRPCEGDEGPRRSY